MNSVRRNALAGGYGSSINELLEQPKPVEPQGFDKSVMKSPSDIASSIFAGDITRLGLELSPIAALLLSWSSEECEMGLRSKLEP
jgi:hypothetical protein